MWSFDWQSYFENEKKEENEEDDEITHGDYCLYKKTEFTDDSIRLAFLKLKCMQKKKKEN